LTPLGTDKNIKSPPAGRVILVLRSVSRFFNLSEAENLLPEIERILRRLIQSKREYDEADEELTRLTQRIALMGGTVPPREEMQQLRLQKDAAARNLKSMVDRIQEIGCELKDLDMGLIDFPTFYRGEHVYLCWKLGEPKIAFWHSLDAGYGGRRPIDSDFLANHWGEK